MEAPFTSRAALLQALLRGPAYGVELVDRIDRATGHRLAPGAVYPALGALVRRRLLRTWKVVPGGRRGGRSRTYYELTYRGLLHAQAEASALASLLKPRRTRFGLNRPSPRLLRSRLARLSDLIAFTEDLRLSRKVSR
ncbi:MAG TPA: helix-turn-helix transcriptional regulator [Vicinamibacteria bacterium]|nr:helix-turn-helix transcriptional regulator [Vicinamibacteria bacterium]